MALPTTSQIHTKAEELFFAANPEAMTTPEINELKEGGYWHRAREALMRGAEAEIEEGEAMEVAGVKESLEKANIMETIRKIEADVQELKTKVKKAPARVIRKKKKVKRKVKPRKMPSKTIHCRVKGCKATIRGATFEVRMAKLRRHRKRKHPRLHRESVKKTLKTKRKRGIINKKRRKKK
jgi:hypothetical protein